ncbi:MAG: hypothetical protein ACOC9Z_02255 [Chloroflexota bacterium]
MNQINARQERTVQRTVVLGCGEVAERVIARLRSRLAASSEPREAVAIVTAGPDDPATESEAVLDAALDEISRVTAREALASRGWRLDRLDEIRLYVLVDAVDGGSLKPVMKIAERFVHLAWRRLNVDTTVALMVLAPEADDGAPSALLRDLRTKRLPGAQGVTVLGAVNEMGLCLDDDDALARAASQILYALIATPLGDAVDRVSGWQGAAAGNAVQSLGITVWEWSPAAARALLARHAVCQVVEQWLSAAPTEAPDAVEWMARLGLGREELARALGLAPAKATVAAPLTYPQPWRLRHSYEPLCELDNDYGPHVMRSLEPTRSDLAEKSAKALRAAAQQMLELQPAGGPARVRRFLQGVTTALHEARERLDADDAAIEERADALAGLHRQLAERMEGRLAAWPRPRLRSWLRVFLSPWHWPALAWAYWQTVQLAQQLVQVAEEWRQWQWQLARIESQRRLYAALVDEGKHLSAQVEELTDMLHHVFRTLDEESTFVPAVLAERPDYVARRYEQIAESPELEAEWAAEVIGGLGQQLVHLDDAFLEPLLAATEERIVAAGDCTAAGALSLLYGTDDELAAWWRERWESAAPLWRYDSTMQDEFDRAQSSHVTLVYGQAAPELRRRLALSQDDDVQWLAGTEPGLTIIRLRNGVPL